MTLTLQLSRERERIEIFNTIEEIIEEEIKFLTSLNILKKEYEDGELAMEEDITKIKQKLKELKLLKGGLKENGSKKSKEKKSS